MQSKRKEQKELQERLIDLNEQRELMIAASKGDTVQQIIESTEKPCK
jgi:hypothetical protein